LESGIPGIQMLNLSNKLRASIIPMVNSQIRRQLEMLRRLDNDLSTSNSLITGKHVLMGLMYNVETVYLQINLRIDFVINQESVYYLLFKEIIL
jgi:hypothetical protein